VTEPERRRPGIRGSHARLDAQYPLAAPAATATPAVPDAAAPGTGTPAAGRQGPVRVQLSGDSYDLAVLLRTLPGLDITRTTVDGPDSVVHGTIQAGVHHYLSTACLHEALTDDPDQAEALHAYCAAEHGRVGAKTPHTCKWGTCPCACPGHR
jgi:hypothetical protein